MLFQTLKFFVFFLIVYSCYINLSHKLQNRWLLIASYVFYGCWDWRFLSLIFLTTVVDYYCGCRICDASSPVTKKKFLILSLSTNLGILGFFKYFNFFAENFQNLASLFGWEVSPFFLRIILPAGVSFYTFQEIGYTIEVYRGHVKAERNFFDFSLFVSFFPQLVAGPIQRAKVLLPQIKMERRVDYAMINQGLWLFFYGFFLKVFVADNVAGIANAVFAPTATSLSGAEYLMGIYAFAFQIFGDFAGYSCMAIGISKLLGINLMINFLYPYFVTSPRDFWKNWHISLSTWLRDYLYIPLGGSQNGEAQTYRNLLITMLLGGLWHGAAWTFVLWGFYQGMILIAHRLMTTKINMFKISEKFSALWLGIRMFVMFHLTCLGWLIFRAKSLEQIGHILFSIVTNFASNVSAALAQGKMIFYYVALFLVIHIIENKKEDQAAIPHLPRIYRNTIYGLMILLLVSSMASSIIAHGKIEEQPFIYFQF